MWATLIFCATTALFLFLTLAACWHLRWVRRLPTLETLTNATNPHPSHLIRCSVVVAARDEETRIEQTIRRLLAQREVDAEFLVVDDRSTDRTGAILRQLANDDSRIKLKRVEVLPEGWLGKCHACHLGASAATGDWILFTDADCWLKPDVINRAVRVAERDRADHVVISPGMDLKTIPTQAWHLLFLTSISHWFSGVNQNRPKSHIGSGAFNLVRADAYRQCGGYEALRLTVLDDVKLGQSIVRAGKRTRAFLGVDEVECHWGTTVRSMVKLLEKNNFAALDFRLGLAMAGAVGGMLLFAIILLGLISRTLSGLIAAFSPLTLILPASIVARKLGWPIRCAILAPFMIPVFLYAMINSTWVTLRQGGIRWRETFYSLEILRTGTLR